MLPRPIQVKPMNHYKLLVTFNNGEQKIYDAKPLLTLPMYKKLNQQNFFFQAKADGMCVYWNDAIDICPDAMYRESVPVAEGENIDGSNRNLTELYR